jgi:menaquinone-dependent protoporphyrinogen IX oxidase
MKAIVIYKSKYGAARQYAHWIGSELNIPVVEACAVDVDKLKNYELVILGSSVYIGKMIIGKWLQKNHPLLAGKKVFMFVVSGTPISKQDQLNSYVTKSVPAEVRNTAQVFFLPGKMVIKELSRFDRFVLTMGAMLGGAKAKEEMLRDYNDVKRENISELAAAVRTTPGIGDPTNDDHSTLKFHSKSFLQP